MKKKLKHLLTLHSTTGFIIKLTVAVEPIYEGRTVNMTKVKEQKKEGGRAIKTTGGTNPAKENEKPACGCCGTRNTAKK